MFRSIATLAAASAAVYAQAPCPPTPVYGHCDIVFELNAQETSAHPNPYMTVKLNAEVRSPHYDTKLIPAFWDGGSRLVIRVAPTEPGEWEYKLASNISRFDGQQGRFTATESDSPGFIRPRNVHHWSYTERNVPHLWMGDTLYNFASVDRDLFRTIVDRRAEQKFTHIRGVALGAKADAARAFPSPDRPNPDFFRNVDERVAYMNSKGIIADLILGWDRNQLTTLFPTWQQRERYLRYMMSRYSAFNVTWELVQAFEEYDAARELMKELGTALKKMDPYNHPRSTGALGTSSPLLGDGWMDWVNTNSPSDDLGAIEHQIFATPFVNTGFGNEDSGAGREGAAGAVDSATFRRRLWNATMNGQYPTFANTGTYGGGRTQDLKYLDSPGARAMKVWYEFFAGTRHWELEPYFDLDGGRAIALPDTEYIIYVEKPSGPVEVRVEKHGYQVRWIDPATGEAGKTENIKEARIVVEPPSRDHDWVLHIEREGRKEGMLRSYKFESRPNLMQEVAVEGKRTPFEIAEPAKDEFSVSTPPRYEAKLTRQTRGTRAMMYLWTGEVSVDSQGFRVIGTGQEGTLQIPRNMAKRYPALMNLRLYGMNANGKVYQLDKIYRLTD